MSFKGNCIARALFDNCAESPDELAFCKGDLLTVLEQNVSRLEGWWLCSLRGRQGICPGNRLRIVPGCYDDGSGFVDAVKSQNGREVDVVATKKITTPQRFGDVFTYDSPRTVSTGVTYDFPSSNACQLTENVPCSARSKLVLSNRDELKLISKHFIDHYDAPRSLECSYNAPMSPLPFGSSNFEAQHYEILSQGAVKNNCLNSLQESKENVGNNIDHSLATPPFFNTCGQQEYDVPRPGTERVDSALNTLSDPLFSNSSSASLVTSESLSLSSIGSASSNKSSIENNIHELYDVPPEPKSLTLSHKKIIPQGSINQCDEVLEEVIYDIPPQVCRDTSESFNSPSRLSPLTHSFGHSEFGFTLDLPPLDFTSFLNTLHKLELDIIAACSRLSSFKESLRDKPKVVIPSIVHLKDLLRGLLDIIWNIIGNTAMKEEQKLVDRIQILAESLKSALIIMRDALRIMNQSNTPQDANREQFDQVASIMTSTSENVRYLVSLIRINTPNLFKNTSENRDEDVMTPVQELLLSSIPIINFHSGLQRENESLAKSSCSSIPTDQNTVAALLSNNDDLSLLKSEFVNDKEVVTPMSEMLASQDPLVTSTKNTSSSTRSNLIENDCHVLDYYQHQMQFKINQLNGAIETFYSSVENNQAPKAFVAQSKFVILTAHQLVYLGDTIHRSLLDEKLRARVLNCTNSLCDAMKDVVIAVKSATLRFPSFVEVQAMVDAFIAVSHLANHFKRAIFS